MVLGNPSSADARGRLGMVLLAHDVHAPAAGCFAQAFSLAPQEPRWPYLLGLAQLPDNPAAAAVSFEQAIRLFPAGDIVPRLRLADTLLALGRSEEAETHYRTIVQAQPNCARARLGLGKVCNARGQNAEAAGFLEGALEDPSTRKAAHRLLVPAYQRLGRSADSERLARVLADLPNDLPFPDPHLAQVQQLETGRAAWTERGDEWIKDGRVAEAAALLEKTVQTYTNADRAMFLLGRARFRMGDHAGAEEILLRSAELAPDSVEAHIQLGIVQLARGDAKAAQRSFRAAIKAKPNIAEAWFNLGLSLGNENHADSVAAFHEAIRLKPNFAQAYLGLAVVLRADGQKEKAAAELRHALSLNPDPALRQKLLEQLKLAERP
jgi:tetratricopeptide (TPR) repeat protein